MTETANREATSESAGPPRARPADPSEKLRGAEAAALRVLGPDHRDPRQAVVAALGEVGSYLGIDALALVTTSGRHCDVEATWPDTGPTMPVPSPTHDPAAVVTVEPGWAELVLGHGPGTTYAVTAGTDAGARLVVRLPDGAPPAPDLAHTLSMVGAVVLCHLRLARVEAALSRQATEAELLTRFGLTIVESDPAREDEVATGILRDLSAHIGARAMCALERRGSSARPWVEWSDGEHRFAAVEIAPDEWDRLRNSASTPWPEHGWRVFPCCHDGEIIGALAVVADPELSSDSRHLVADTVELLRQLRARATAERRLARQRELVDIRATIATAYVEAKYDQVLETTTEALRVLGEATGSQAALWATLDDDGDISFARGWARGDGAAPEPALDASDVARFAAGDRAYAAPLADQRQALLVPARVGARTVGAVVLILEPDRDLPDHDLAVLEQMAFLIQQMEEWAEVESATEKRRRQLEFQATHDELTGLANRRLLVDSLAEAIRDGPVAVLMIDMDRFKVVNDSLGHTAGDAVLTTIGDRIRFATREPDLVCRFGGDEFAVMVPGGGDPVMLAALASRLIERAREPLTVQETTLMPTCSIGIAMTSEGDDVESVLRHADAALYEAKARGRDRYEFFDDARREWLQERLSLETDLRRGLRDGQFGPWFQPEVDLLTGELVGAEALVRWFHPTDGTVPAGRFIEVAEEVGLAGPISQIALEDSCRALAEWRRAGIDISVRVNVAAAQLQAGDFDARVRDVLDRHGIPARALCVEITERSLMFDPDQSALILGRLRDMGIEIAVDDFGTGFSSLARLRYLPVDTLKIDRSFVAGLGERSTDRDIVKTILGLADAIGLQVVAEGVETEEQAAILVELGCRRAQGWLWHAAMPADQLTRLLLPAAS